MTFTQSRDKLSKLRVIAERAEERKKVREEEDERTRTSFEAHNRVTDGVMPPRHLNPRGRPVALGGGLATSAASEDALLPLLTPP